MVWFFTRRRFLILFPAALLFFSLAAVAHATSLRFTGNAVPDVDKVMIRIDPDVPADVGGSFTVEFWMRANAADNTSSTGCVPGADDHWITGNIIIDRAIWEHDRNGDYGISMFSTDSTTGTLAFGVFKKNAFTGAICGSMNVADGQWHHVAITRNNTGQMRIFVDGQLDVQGTGPSGDISYEDGVPSSPPATVLNVDNYLGIGAEKFDADPARFPSFNGWVDEVRISSMIRYTGNFTRPSAPFQSDNDTAALYHFDEGAGTVVTDSAPGGMSPGEVRVGSNPTRPVWSADTPFSGGAGAGNISFTSSAFSVGEPDGSASVSVLRSGGASGAATVQYETAAGTATAGTDYTDTSGSLSWNDGESGLRAFSVAIVADTVSDPGETVDLSLTNATGATLGNIMSSTLTISDSGSSSGGGSGSSSSGGSSGSGGSGGDTGGGGGTQEPVTVLTILISVFARLFGALSGRS